MTSLRDTSADAMERDLAAFRRGDLSGLPNPPVRTETAAEKAWRRAQETLDEVVHVIDQIERDVSKLPHGTRQRMRSVRARAAGTLRDIGYAAGIAAPLPDGFVQPHSASSHSASSKRAGPEPSPQGAELSPEDGA